MQNSLCVEILRSPIWAALLHGTRAVGVSKTLRRDIFTRQGGHPFPHWAVELSSFYVDQQCCRKYENRFIGRPFVNRFALCYGTVVCPACHASVTLVYYDETVGWINIPHGMAVGFGSCYVMLDGDPAPLKGAKIPNFGPCLLWPNGWMGEDASW